MFGLPQGASLRQTEEQLTTPTPRQGDAYGDMALGTALRDEDGFAKVLVGDGEILGCHVIGLEALTLIHKVSTAVGDGPTPQYPRDNPQPLALLEVIQGTLQDGQDVTSAGI